MRKSAAAGFSLVELMVAMAITMALSTGLITLLMSTRGNSVAQGAMEQLQDDQRLVLTRLTDTVQNAGYFGRPMAYNSNVGQALPAATGTSGSATWTFAAGQGIYGVAGTSGNPDTLHVRYLSASGDGVLDCTGATNSSGADVMMVNTFSVDAAGNFTCTTSGGTVVPLAGGVSGFTVQYGVDTNGDGSADEYRSASAVVAAGGWGLVMSVRVTLSFQNPLGNQPGGAATLPPVIQVIPLLNQI